MGHHVVGYVNQLPHGHAAVQLRQTIDRRVNIPVRSSTRETNGIRGWQLRFERTTHDRGRLLRNRGCRNKKRRQPSPVNGNVMSVNRGLTKVEIKKVQNQVNRLVRISYAYPKLPNYQGL